MQKWEYYFLALGDGYKDKAARINELGDDGWEPVSVVPVTVDSGIVIAYHYYFKRPI